MTPTSQRAARYTGAERRIHPRSFIPLPLTVSGVDASGIKFDVAALLHDFSLGGLYMRIPRRVDPGMSMGCLFHSQSGGGPKGSQVFARGVVLRAAPQTPALCDVAVQFTSPLIQTKDLAVPMPAPEEHKPEVNETPVSYCPTCHRTFDGGLIFCGYDGTHLVKDATAFSPSALMDASQPPSRTTTALPSDPYATTIDSSPTLDSEAPTEVFRLKASAPDTISDSQTERASTSSPLTGNVSSSPSPEERAAKSSTGLEPNVAALLAYVLTWVTGLIFFLIEKEDRFVRFHAMQAILFGVSTATISILVGIAIGVMTYLSAILGLLCLLAWLVCMLPFLAGWIICMIKAYQGQMLKLPLIGKMAEAIVNK